MRSRIGAPILVVALLGLNGCEYYNETNPGDPSTITPQTVSWARVSAGFFGPRCAVCHGQGGAGVNVSDYADVLAQLGRIQEEVFTRGRMPPDSPLTAYEQTLLSVWIEAGTPFAASGGGP